MIDSCLDVFASIYYAKLKFIVFKFGEADKDNQKVMYKITESDATSYK